MYKWLKEWGSHLPVLERAKALGQDPSALKTKPEIPWYYESILLHFEKLSFSRRYSQLGPLPIDIHSIFLYNERITRMRDEDFLDLIQALDAVYLKPKEKIEVK